MPLYDYRCDECGHVHEAFSSIAGRDRSDVECPLCGTRGCQREVSAGAVMGGESGFGSPSSFPSVPT
jgi:putative FmdB family regulatory protein